MGVEDHKCHSVKSVNCAVLTVSDTRTEETDDSGRLIRDLLRGRGHSADHYEILRDEETDIRERVNRLVGRQDVQAVLVTGGTGIGERDVTVEAVSPLLDKELPGFGELFRMLSYRDVGSAALLSRAFAGTVGGKVVICLPGSVNAVRLAMEKLVLEELGHMVREVTR